MLYTMCYITICNEIYSNILNATRSTHTENYFDFSQDKREMNYSSYSINEIREAVQRNRND